MFVFEGRALDDDRTLRDLGIPNRSTLSLQWKVRGRGAMAFSFSTMDSSKLDRRDWSDSAPAWWVATAGKGLSLSLEY